MAKAPRTEQTVTRVDCLEGFKTLKAPADLIVADPPYNLGMDYDAYEDSKPHDEYLAWSERWIGAATAALHKHGTLWVFAPDEWVSEIDLLCRRQFKLYRKNWIVWTFTFGQACQSSFSRSHCHILRFVKTKSRFVFNEDAVRVPSARQAIYGDKRANPKGKLPDDVWLLYQHQLETVLTGDRDVWLVSRVCGTFQEREKHSPNQIPLPIMERIVLSTSLPGANVLDPFCGTGSTAVACTMHHRNFKGFDVSKRCVEQSLRRIEEARQGRLARSVG
jgi:DNA modification methylase